jgi:hypothetical protein
MLMRMIHFPLSKQRYYFRRQSEHALVSSSLQLTLNAPNESDTKAISHPSLQLLR